ncbi:MAG TPA: hypothetical protein VK211_12655 [Kamptonema sp.]|nr:hypothetical protein [Kamptonema sp.]
MVVSFFGKIPLVWCWDFRGKVMGKFLSKDADEVILSHCHPTAIPLFWKHHRPATVRSFHSIAIREKEVRLTKHGI